MTGTAIRRHTQEPIDDGAAYTVKRNNSSFFTTILPNSCMNV